MSCDGACQGVLIPLNSGLAWSTRQRRPGATLGLNPFEFRAGLERETG